MSTVEDFENAPIGATATDADGNRAMKTDLGEWCWVFQNGDCLDDEEMERRGYTLDPSAPTTAREALDLAWELAHPVKEGQVIPKGARYLEFQGSGLREYTTASDFKIRPGCVPIRTLDPLPEPEPDWVDALVVLARHVKQTPDSPPTLWANLGGGLWGHVETTKRVEAWDLRDVTPLYPKEVQEA